MIQKLEEFDKSFSEGTFLTKVDHIFIMILTSIMDNDMTRVKHYLNPDIFNKYEELVNHYKEKGYTRLFDEMNVKSTSIENVTITDTQIIVNVLIISRYMDYFLDENGEYLSGENTRRIEKEQRITFTKEINAESLKQVRHCPSCGANLDLNDTAICKYCNNTFDMSKYDYIITQMDII